MKEIFANTCHHEGVQRPKQSLLPVAMLRGNGSPAPLLKGVLKAGDSLLSYLQLARLTVGQAMTKRTGANAHCRLYTKIIFFLLIFVFFVYLTGFSYADETITLKNLIQEALRENPQIKSAKASWDASQAVPKQVSTLPDPMIMLGIRNIGSKYSIGIDPMSMLDLGVMQWVPFPGKLSLLGKIAGKRAEAVSEEYRATLLNVIAGLKTAFFDYYYIKKSIETVNNTIELLKKLEKTAKIRYEVGKGIQQDVWKAQLEISRLLERLEVLTQLEGSTVARINSILNRPPDASLVMPADFEQSKFEYTIDDLLKMAEDNSPDLIKSDRIVEREKYNLTYSKLQYLPDFSLNLGWAYRGSLDTMWYVAIGIEVPLYFWRKQVYGLKEALSNLASAEHAYQNTKEVLFAEIKSLYLEVTTSMRLVELYKTAIVPQSSAALESSMASYSVGKVDFLTMVTNVITLLDYELAYYQKLVEYEKAIAKLEALTGVQFATEVEK